MLTHCCAGSPAGEERQAPPQSLPAAPSTGDKPKEFEMGWDEALFRPWRREILSAKKRGPVELGNAPDYDPNTDPDAPISCKFKDGTPYEVAHITMVPHHTFVQSNNNLFLLSSHLELAHTGLRCVQH